MTKTHVDEALLAELRTAAEQPAAAERYLAELADLVAIRSGVGDAAGVARVAEALAEPLRELGAEVTLRDDGPAGPTLVARVVGAAPGRRIALVGHMDTVAAPHDPEPRLTIRDGRAWGPGSADMKGGLLLVVHVLRALRSVTGTALPSGELTAIFGPDEEVGSPVGWLAMRDLVPGCDAALVLEPGRPGGAVVVARKGMHQARIRVSGRAAHAGVEPEQGRSALLAAAHATIALHALSGTGAGVTVNVGVLNGGTRPNVVPAEAVLEVDLRASALAAMEATEGAIRAICAAPAVPDVTMTLEPAGRFVPMERLPSTDLLLERFRSVAAALGQTIDTVTTGGASDANQIASLHVPVLDGLGPVGAGMHGADENILIASVPDRVALLAGALLGLTASR